MEPHTLQHPLEQWQPVATHAPGGQPSNWAQEHPIWTHLGLPLAVTINQACATVSCAQLIAGAAHVAKGCL